MARMKRVVAIGDMHCGHRAGLTPPEYRFRECSEDHIWKKYTKVQEEGWKFYAEAAKKLCPIDVLIVNGDCIDGRGEKSGGVELLTVDRKEQCAIAAACIMLWKPPVIVMTRGTPYHAGEIESWEDEIADMVAKQVEKVKIGDHEFVDVNGYVFDVKHHIGGSQVPHGRITALSRDEIWNELWNEAGLQPRANKILRSHVHYNVGGYRRVANKRIEFDTLPALQAMGTRFGARRCSGTVDFGLLGWDISKDGRKVCEHDFVTGLRSTKATVLTV